jgi:S1-C subfamily serine protease
VVSPAVVRVEVAGREARWGRGRARVGHGSGVVVDAAAGYVLTNFHVIRGAELAEVTFGDGRAVAGQVIGTDPVSDLALVKVAADGLAAAAFGDSDNLSVGQVVLALGNPDGDRVVITSGIISALGRRLRGPTGRLLEGLIQTDALFNPGMSGGPLVNAAGQVVGINTASLVEAQGINLAIPANHARRLAGELAAAGRVRRAVLGIAGERQRIYEGLVRHYNLVQSHGVLVQAVEPGGPADQAGIQAGDLVVTVGSNGVQGVDDLHRVLSAHNVGDEVQVVLLRDLDRLEVVVRLGPG